MFQNAEPMTVGTTIFINRSPVINRQGKIHSYRLELFTAEGADLADPLAVTNALEQIRPEEIVGGRIGLVRMSADTAANLFVPTPWRKKLVPEVAMQNGEGETLPQVIDNLRTQASPLCIRLSPRNDIKRIKVPPHLMIADVRDAASFAAAFGAILDDTLLIADCVNTPEAYEEAKGRGFDLFEGDFYLQPPDTAKKLSSSQVLLLDLSRATVRGTGIEEVEAIFRKDPDLTYGLLNLAHSAFFRVPDTVTSIRQAIALLGYEQLHKWVSLMLFAVDNTDPSANPLFERPLTRARTMELLCWRIGKGALADPAFVTGLFSLVHVLLGITVEEVLEKTNLSPDIREAVLHRTGNLVGALLDAVERLERGALKGDPGTPDLPMTNFDLLAARTEAIMAYQVSLTPTSVTEMAGKPAVKEGQTSEPVLGPRRTFEEPEGFWARLVGWFVGLFR